MRKPLTLFVMSSVLVACGGDNSVQSSSSSISASSASKSSASSIANSSSSVSVSSSSSPAVSSSSSSSSAVSSSSKSSVSSSSAPSVFDGDPVTGEAIFKTGNQCGGCHQDPEEDGVITGLGQFDVNSWQFPTDAAYAGAPFTGESVEDLSRFVFLNMAGFADACDSQCSEDVAAYLWSLRGQDQVVEAANCVSDDPVYYGERSLKLLTSYEYHNSMQGLFTAPLPADYSSPVKTLPDRLISNLPNHKMEEVEQSRLEGYNRNAAEVAKWAAVSGHDGKCMTASSQTCLDWFVNDFAMMAFRRPLKAAEADTFRTLITGSASGLEWAFHTVLMSPQFLYRSELGVKVSDARIDPFFSVGGNNSTGTGSSADGYEAGAGAVTVNGAAFTTKTTGMDNADGTYNLWSQGYVANNFNFSDPSIVIINVKGNDYEKRWPQMTVSVGSKIIAMVMVEHYALSEYRYLVPALTGSQQLKIEFSNLDEGRVPYGTPGNDKNLYVGNVTVGPAVMKAAPEPVPVEAEDPLTAADADAYVLDSYEYASALAYMYTGSGPDKALLSAVATGAMNDPAQVEMHIDRMLDSALGRKQVERFAGMWFRTDGVLGVSRDGNPNFTDKVRQSMAQEVREIFKHAFYDETVAFKDIYRGNFTMLDSTLSQFYGIPGGGSAHMQFAKVQLEDANPRGGVVASGAFMATWAHVNHTSPIKRAVHFRQDFLCQAIPLPLNLNDGDERDAAGLEVKQLMATGNLTTTEFYHLQTDVGSCSSCHKDIINPLFAIDDFDQYGLPRKRLAGEVVQKGLGSVFELGTDGNRDVPVDMINEGGFLYDADGVGVVSVAAAADSRTQGTGLAFSGAKELSRLAAEQDLPGLDACLIEKSFRFATGSTTSPDFMDARDGEKALTEEQKSHFLCVAEDLTTTLNANGGSPRAMLKALGMSDVIRFRR